MMTSRFMPMISRTRKTIPASNWRISRAGAGLAVLTILVLLQAASPDAGQLSPDLAASVSQKNPGDFVSVWIKLYDSEGVGNLKAQVGTAVTRAERHYTAITSLKTEHGRSQADLLKHLGSLQNQKVARAVRPHWIVNVIEADITVARLENLAGRSDVEIIYAVPELVTADPGTAASLSSSTAGVESNLTYINAPAAWAAGYTGAGRVVCTFDTGVDGLHPALYNSWKGLDGDSAAAWFDPAKNEPFPHTIPDCGVTPCRVSHGTHVLGTIVGHDDVSGDTVGVAPDAKWISAAVIDVAGAAILDAFEWAADPDGDPNSLDDVPDVINHSWGAPYVGCQNIFYDVITNVEALGIINIFAAGNEGPDPFTIRNPADHAANSLDCFAVGALDHNTSTIFVASSRGPSDCNPQATKPNVVAPGVLIRSSLPGGYYGSLSGSSMAAPHVSGLVALMRQKNPNATVDQIKQAILNTTDNLGFSLPNNDYGWGLVDCMAALDALSETNSTPNVRVYSFDHDPIAPGDEVTGTLVLKNVGADVAGVSASLIENNSALTVLAGSASFSDIVEGDTARADDPFTVAVADTVTPGSILSLDLNIAGTGYSVTRKIYFVVEPRTSRSFITHNVGNIEFSLSGYGTFGLGDNSSFPVGGVGFRFRGGDNYLYDGGLMIGTDGAYVSDGVLNPVGEPDGDFAVMPGGNITLVTPVQGVAQQSFARFSDERSEGTLGLNIEQHSFVFDTSPYRNFVLLQYVIENTSSNIYENVYIGFHLDWDVGVSSNNVGGYEPDQEFLWMAQNNFGLIENYRGARALHGLFVTACTDTTSLLFMPPMGDDGYTDAEKRAALKAGLSSPEEYRTGYRDLFQVVAVRAHLSAHDIDTVAFALLAGQSLSEIRQASEESFNAYVEFLMGGQPPPVPIPEVYTLYQNYPNPFNEGTTISFNLENASNYTLSVYNILGRKVAERSGRDGPGLVEIPFTGQSLASGIYLYRLRAGNFDDSKKMLLLK